MNGHVPPIHRLLQPDAILVIHALCWEPSLDLQGRQGNIRVGLNESKELLDVR
jgi:hypothetical protein